MTRGPFRRDCGDGDVRLELLGRRSDAPSEAATREGNYDLGYIRHRLDDFATQGPLPCDDQGIVEGVGQCPPFVPPYGFCPLCGVVVGVNGEKDLGTVRCHC